MLLVFVTLLMKSMALHCFPGFLASAGKSGIHSPKVLRQHRYACCLLHASYVLYRGHIPRGLGALQGFLMLVSLILNTDFDGAPPTSLGGVYTFPCRQRLFDR